MSKPPQDGNTEQMDIFRTLLSPDNDTSTLSNLLDIWDQIPKYHVTQAEQKNIRAKGNITTVESQVVLSDDKYDIEIKPALIKIDNKTEIYFPSETEEIIESILRKMLLDQNLGIHKNNPQTTWVKFSIRMIQSELKKIGKSRSHVEIRRSLEILSSSIYVIKRNGKKIHSGGIFSDWIDKQNEDLPADDVDALSAIQFSNMVSKAITTLDFRQYDYLTTSKLKNPVARWLMKRMSIYFKSAGFNVKKGGHNAFKIDYSTIVAESLLLDSIQNEKNKKKKIRQAIDELIDSDILIGKDQSDDEVEIIRYAADKRTIIDITFQLFATNEFAQKMKAANKRKSTINLKRES